MSVNYCFVVTAYMSEEWIGKCLNSIQKQKVRDFRCVVIDNHSSDGTYEIAQRIAGNDERFILKRNDSRNSMLANVANAIPEVSVDPRDVIIVINAYDWLKHPGALERLDKEYSDPNIWMTYGGYEVYKDKLLYKWGLRHKHVRVRKYPLEITVKGLFRYYDWQDHKFVAFRRFLWDCIKDEDLRDEGGCYYRVGGDCAWIFPMLEMAGVEHTRHIRDGLYVYNKGVRTREEEVYRIDKVITEHKIRFQPRYKKIEIPEKADFDPGQLPHFEKKPDSKLIPTAKAAVPEDDSAGATGLTNFAEIMNAVEFHPEDVYTPVSAHPRSKLYRAHDGESAELEVCEFVWALVRIVKPLHILETGTHKGIMARFICEALKSNGRGDLVTIELDEKLNRYAGDLLAGYENVDVVLSDSLAYNTDMVFDICIFDSDIPIRVKEFYKYKEKNMRPGSLVLFHDVAEHRVSYWTAVNGLFEKGELKSRLWFDTPRGLIIGAIP